MNAPVLDQLLEAIQYSFIQRALIAGVLIGICCSFLGVFLVLRRLSLIGDGLAHVAFGAVGLALLLDAAPLYVAVPVTVLGALCILQLAERARVFGDAAIGLVASVCVAAGVMMASLGGGFNVDLFSYLFGSILAISTGEVALCVGLSLAVISVVVLLYHDLFAVTLEEEYAHVLGVRTGLVNRVLACCTALTVVLGVRVVGTLLVSSLIIFPSVTALQLARGFRGAIALATGVSVFSVVVGILLSFLLDLPTGATIVLVNAVLFALAYLAGRARG